jgi:hypothetical protein
VLYSHISMTTRIERHRRWKIEVVLSCNPGPKEKMRFSVNGRSF